MEVTMHKFILGMGTTIVANRKVKYPLILVENHEGLKDYHLISSVIFKKWKRLEYNTQRKYAGMIVSLLNWLLDNQIKLGMKEVKLSNLTINHLSMFLNEKNNEGLTRTTMKTYERTLIMFCEFLVEHDIASDDVRKRVTEHEDRTTFFEIVLYNNDTSEVLHDLRRELIFPFIEFAVKVANPIALGVYYQIFGGLRRGEIVNIKRQNVQLLGVLGENGHRVKITQDIMRSDIKDSAGSSSVKTSKNFRDAVIHPSPILQGLYENHLKTYSNESGNDALFVGKNGLAMTGTTYSYYFNKLKKEFIQFLLNHKNTNLVAYGGQLASVKWSTHIGRGIFSNWYADTTDNPLTLARARGDRSLDSSLAYIDNTTNVKNKVKTAIEQLYENRGEYDE